MLAKKYRLPVQSVLAMRGMTRRGRYFLLKTFVAQKEYSRLGVIVSSAVAAKATRRNKLKRIAYDVASQVRTKLPLADYLLIAQRGPYDTVAPDAIIKELQSLLLP